MNTIEKWKYIKRLDYMGIWLGYSDEGKFYVHSPFSCPTEHFNGLGGFDEQFTHDTAEQAIDAWYDGLMHAFATFGYIVHDNGSQNTNHIKFVSLINDNFIYIHIDQARSLHEAYKVKLAPSQDKK